MLIETALKALNNAMSETQDNLTLLGEGGQPSPAAIAKLVYLWRDAAAELRDIDAKLSAECHLMARRWSEPDSWSDMWSPTQRTAYTNLRHAFQRTQPRIEFFLNTHGAGDGGKD